METNPSRLAGFDDLRAAVIALVVLVHANVTYSGIGSWYYVETPTSSLDPLGLVLMGTLGMFLQAWFMGVLFFLAGLMAVPSLERKGKGAFLRDRAVRLLGPYFLFVLGINPLMLAAFRPEWLSWDPVRILSGSGPLWFTGALFLVTALWVPLARLRGTPVPRPHEPRRGLGGTGLWVLLALAIGAAAWVVRIVQPIGTSVFNFQLCFFPGYLVLFGAGVGLARSGRLKDLPAAWGRLVWITPLVSVPLLLALLVGAGALSGDRTFLGGGSLSSLAYALWEGATGVAMTLGLVVRARDRSALETVSNPLPWRRSFRKAGFGIYVLHTPVLWGLSLALAGVAVWAPVKALGVAVLALALTWGLAVAAERIPALRRLLA